MTNKCMGRYLPSLVTRETQIKATPRRHLTPTNTPVAKERGGKDVATPGILTWFWRLFHMKPTFHSGVYTQKETRADVHGKCVPCSQSQCALELRVRWKCPARSSGCMECGLEILGHRIQSLRAVQRLQSCGSDSGCFSTQM